MYLFLIKKLYPQLDLKYYKKRMSVLNFYCLLLMGFICHTWFFKSK